MATGGSSGGPSFWSVVGIAWQLGYTIAVPLVVLAFVGRFLDRKFGTSPWLLLAGILLALVVTGIGVTRQIRALNR